MCPNGRSQPRPRNEPAPRTSRKHKPPSTRTACEPVREAIMQLALNDADAQALQAILRDYLPGLRREAARTSLASRELRHELYMRQDLCERLVADLEQASQAVEI